MFHMKYLLNFIFLHSILAIPHINLYYTDGVQENDNASQHNCLRIVVKLNYATSQNEVVSYCMGELPPRFNIEKNDSFSKFLTFDDLSKENVTSQQLYLWSAPIDVIERYQFYLNQLTTKTNDSSLGGEFFYNCTLPRFGPLCQYELYYHDPHHSSLYEIIWNYYAIYGHYPNNLTCYMHLKCNRGLFPACLDWTEVCDGKVDCIDGAFDEEYCWQLEINECKDNEYRCKNGQCIPLSFSDEEANSPHCIDLSDMRQSPLTSPILWHPRAIPSPISEDVSCANRYSGSSCMSTRKNLLETTMYASKDSSASSDCWSAFQCLLNFEDLTYSLCDKPCEHDTCIKIIQNTCPDMLFFPNVPVLFSNIYFAYGKNDLLYWTHSSPAPLYICYNTSQYDDFFIRISKIFFDNMTCIHSKQILSSNTLSSSQGKVVPDEILYDLYKLLVGYHLTFNYTSAICNRPNMYQCSRSPKCISVHRLMNTIADCLYRDDEDMASINNADRIEQYEKTHYKCQTTGKYIHRSLINNNHCDCERFDDAYCEDEDMHITFLNQNIVFQHICDGFTDLLPRMIAGQNETDETECGQWQCNNIYTRCNDVWNCPNGADESGCVSDSTLNCSSKEHLCVSLNTKQLICLSIEKINDGNVDCIGGTDEPTLCGKKIQRKPRQPVNLAAFHCTNHSSKLCISWYSLCDGKNDCEHGDDEQFCTKNETSLISDGICSLNNHPMISDAEKFLCDHRASTRYWAVIPYKLDTTTNLVENQVKNMKNAVFPSLPIIQRSNQYQSRCHRGLDLHVWLNNKNNSTNICLCPSSFYGDICQYQNQRISLIIKFRALADSWKTPFAIVISLIDSSDERIIHSYEQITFLSMKHCQTEHYMHLLYSTQPKDLTKNYSLHIDIYEKITLDYRGSVLVPVAFPFLPVQRIAVIVDIPQSDDKTEKCSNDLCVHGKCIKYSNNPENITFCQCNQGWSGRYCTTQYTCTCASHSLCIGISSNNRSICVCLVNQFGPRCLLTETMCQTNNLTCQNGGRCIPITDFMVSDQNFVCICPIEFTGDRCEIAANELILSFGEGIIPSQEMFIHFIEVMSGYELIEFTTRATILKTILVKKDSVIIYWSQPFHLIFIEFSKTYYLTVVQNTYNQSTTIIKMINPSDRCPNIRELFNETFVQWDLIRRIKYYHLPCQNDSLNLSCFYDDVHLCLCHEFKQQRQANCFIFDHNMKFDCNGQSECEHGGQCFQDNPDCPQKSICVCPTCYYGTRCQFSTSGFTLSLDAILGYHILPDVNIIHQPGIVQTSVALTTIFIVAGFINGILAMITFKNKSVREVGCGIYLLGSSITTLLTTIIFGLKFWILILAQTETISNKFFLYFQCLSIDFLLRICISMDQWLNACVAIERATTVIKGARFNKKKSRQAAKLVIILLLVFIVGICIHEPFYRRLFVEENNDEEKRIWCIISYPPSLQLWNTIVQIFNVLVPFLTNIISAILLVIMKSHQQSKSHTQRNYNEILRKEFRQRQNLFISPVLLFILTLPRVILVFASKCMKSTNDSWLFLIGYFISFIPPMLTFLVFVIPSEFYKKEFRKSVVQYRTNI